MRIGRAFAVQGHPDRCQGGLSARTIAVSGTDRVIDGYTGIRASIGLAAITFITEFIAGYETIAASADAETGLALARVTRFNLPERGASISIDRLIGICVDPIIAGLSTPYPGIAANPIAPTGLTLVSGPEFFDYTANTATVTRIEITVIADLVGRKKAIAAPRLVTGGPIPTGRTLAD